MGDRERFALSFSIASERITYVAPRLRRSLRLSVASEFRLSHHPLRDAWRAVVEGTMLNRRLAISHVFPADCPHRTHFHFSKEVAPDTTLLNVSFCNGDAFE